MYVTLAILARGRPKPAPAPQTGTPRDAQSAAEGPPVGSLRNRARNFLASVPRARPLGRVWERQARLRPLLVDKLQGVPRVRRRQWW